MNSADPLEAAYRDCGPAGYSLAHHLLDDQRLAADVVFAAFTGWWKELAAGSAAPAGPAVDFFARVHRLAVDTARRQHHRPPPPGEESAPRPLDTGPAQPRMRHRAAVQQAFAGLSDPDRRVVRLAYFGGRTQQEIAALTGSPLATVRAQLRTAVAALRADFLARFRTPDGSFMTPYQP